MSTENIFSLYAIETDGSRVGRSRDPPGQRSVYIAPGTCPLLSIGCIGWAT